MAGSAIIRGDFQIINGVITHDDKPLAWADADRMAGHRLDRRKSWAFVSGQLCEAVSWSRACSGCYDGYDGDYARGMGCSECGYRGRIRNGAWVPVSSTSHAESTQ